MNKKIIIRIILCFGWARFIFYNSSKTGEESKIQSYKIVDSIKKEDNINSYEKENINKNQNNVQNNKDKEDKTIQIDTNKKRRKFNNYLRKFAHVLEYFILAILVISLLSALRIQKNKLYGLSLVVVVLYAISDELHQRFVPGRGSSVSDVIIDSLGAIIGILVWYSVKNLKKNLKNIKKFSNTC